MFDFVSLKTNYLEIRIIPIVDQVGLKLKFLLFQPPKY